MVVHTIRDVESRKDEGGSHRARCEKLLDLEV